MVFYRVSTGIAVGASTLIESLLKGGNVASAKQTARLATGFAVAQALCFGAAVVGARTLFAKASRVVRAFDIFFCNRAEGLSLGTFVVSALVRCAGCFIISADCCATVTNSCAHFLLAPSPIFSYVFRYSRQTRMSCR